MPREVTYCCSPASAAFWIPPQIPWVGRKTEELCFHSLYDIDNDILCISVLCSKRTTFSLFQIHSYKRKNYTMEMLSSTKRNRIIRKHELHSNTLINRKIQIGFCRSAHLSIMTHPQMKNVKHGNCTCVHYNKFTTIIAGFIETEMLSEPMSDIVGHHATDRRRRRPRRSRNSGYIISICNTSAIKNRLIKGNLLIIL